MMMRGELPVCLLVLLLGVCGCLQSPYLVVAGAPVTASNECTPTVLGCFNVTQSEDSTSVQVASLSDCAAACYNISKFGIGAVSGDKCMCSSSTVPFGSNVTDDMCNTPCLGNAANVCGGHQAYTEFSFVCTTEGNASTTATTAASKTTTAPVSTTQPITERIKGAVLAKGWIPFTVVLVVCLVYAWMFVGYYQHTREKEFGSTVITILAISSALLASTIVPLDVYLVSQFKSSSGVWHDWALDNEDFLLNTTTYAYYAAYALVMLFVFLLVPLSYFFFEEKDEVENPGCMKRFLHSIKYTIVLLILMGIIMCIGAFALSTNGDACQEQQLNATDWKKWSECRVDFAKKSITSNNGANAISFTIGLLTVVGVLYFVFYTAAGMVYLPLNMIRSRLSNKKDFDEAESRIRINKDRREAIKSRNRSGRKSRMSRKDRRLLDETDHELRVLEKATRRAEKIQNGFLSKCFAVFRPFEFIFGIVFMLLSLFIVASLGISSGDKLLQIVQQNLNWKTGYSQAAPRVINPVDAMFKALQTVFPLDYVVLVLLIFYFLACTMAGVRALGVRFCGYKIYDIKRSRTVPQALLFLSTIVIFTLLFINVVLLTLSPQYITYGNQKFPDLPEFTNTSTVVTVSTVGNLTTPTLCNSKAPASVFWVNDAVANEKYVVNLGVYDEKTENNCAALQIPTTMGMFDLTDTARFMCSKTDACTSSRVAALLHAFFYNMWFLGMIYYWANWGFILVFFMALIYLGCKRRKSLIANIINDSKHDFNDSDDDMTPFAPSWMK